VNQTVRDCLEEAMDFEGLRRVLRRIHAGELRLIARDTPEPSVFAYEILDARPYAFLDDAPLEERRSHAVQTRRGAGRTDEMGALDPEAIERVRGEERPDPRDADELHDALMTAGYLALDEIAGSPDSLARLTANRRATVTAVGVVAAERVGEIRAVHPQLSLDPPVTPPASRSRLWTRDEAIVELLRGRLTLTGPATAQSLADSLRITPSEANAALLALESDGVILRGRFTAFANSAPANLERVEWCDRALLARIHRYTVNRLRAEIEPVSPADFMRFLFKWQHVDPSDRLRGHDGLREAVSLLDGFEAPAAAWERVILAARVDDYDPSMLDMLCLAGEAAWSRLSPPAPDALDAPRLTGATPVALFQREHANAWLALRSDGDREQRLSPDARTVLTWLRTRGASFFADIRQHTALDDDAARAAVGSLVAAGLAASDGFSGLRALMWTADGRLPGHDRRASFAGRWSEIPVSAAPIEDALAAQAWALLRRYGVVFRRVIARDPLAAPWRDLARVYRRLEARGEIRGGRFVAGMSGEQFALPRAVERLREVRRSSADGRTIVISTADPLNLAGIVTTGERLRISARNRITYRDGVPVAVRESDVVRPVLTLEPAAL
jgi:ATP-dependent Lhr-like helicase